MQESEGESEILNEIVWYKSDKSCHRSISNFQASKIMCHFSSK